jgi:hypothetical protein
MFSFVVVAPWQHEWVPRWRRMRARSRPKLRGEGQSPPVLYGRRRLLFMPHVLALVTVPAHVSDLIADDGPYI